MSFASVNVFAVRPGTMDDFVALQNREFLPLLQVQQGFRGFEIVRSGADTGVATLWWATESDRIAATPALNVWVEEKMVPYIVTLDNPAGPVVCSWRSDEPASGLSEKEG